ncbi:hotdog fold domain-containing protein [Bacterioplanoides sp.]|uniref:hotdog fold domain-containing protein n=1 Tax=Bacterioplanoides sp. TaxID=2066072 RepID=UPI003B59389E
MSQYLKMFNQLGPEMFSKGISQVAPYFSTIDPHVVDLKPGYCEVFLKKQTKVQNHIGTVHAIAMCNAAELAAGVVTDVSVPEGARWIPQGMTVKYLAKAKTDLKVVSNVEDVDFSQGGEIPVHVSAFDTEGTEVFCADITMNVKLS